MYDSTFLTEKWGISRGMDTYGYNICTVRDAKSGAKGRCNGGGYDMAGSSLAECLENMQGAYNRLAALITKENAGHYADELLGRNEYHGGEACRDQGRFYGTTYRIDRKGTVKISIDGATGYNNVMDIYAKAGVTITPSYDQSKRNHSRIGWFVSWED